MEFEGWQQSLIHAYVKGGSPLYIIAELLNCEEKDVSDYLKRVQKTI